MRSPKAKMSKGGYKKHRSKRPVGISRSGLPKIFPPHIDATLRIVKKK